MQCTGTISSWQDTGLIQDGAFETFIYLIWNCIIQRVSTVRLKQGVKRKANFFLCRIIFVYLWLMNNKCKLKRHVTVLLTANYLRTRAFCLSTFADFTEWTQWIWAVSTTYLTKTKRHTEMKLTSLEENMWTWRNFNDGH